MDKKSDTIADHTIAVNGGGTTDIFTGEDPQEHIIYIGDEKLFDVKNGKIVLDLEEFDTIPESIFAHKDRVYWEYGTVATNQKNEKLIGRVQWIPFQNLSSQRKKLMIFTGTESIDRVEVNGCESRWIRCRLNENVIPKLKDLSFKSIKVETSAVKIEPEILFYNDIPIDDHGEWLYPIGTKPYTYDTFYVGCADAFSKKGYSISFSFSLSPGQAGPDEDNNLPQFSWEYWDGDSWRSLNKFIEFSVDGQAVDPRSEELIQNWVSRSPTEKSLHVTVNISEMIELKPGNVNGKDNYWIRVKLIEGNYGTEYTITKKNKLEPGKYHPPKIKNLKLQYCNKREKKPEHIFAMNNLVFKDCRDDLMRTKNCKPFEALPDTYPTIYFGYDAELRKGPISLFIHLTQNSTYPQTIIPKIKWQYFSKKDGEWAELEILDGTGGFTKSGMLQFLVPEKMGALRLFGSTEPLYWLRAAFIDGKSYSKVHGFYLNSTWAIQSRTINNERIGSSSGEAHQLFKLLNKPVIDVDLWINEVNGLSEGEKQTLLKDKQYVELKTDDKDTVVEFWVKWTETDDFIDLKSKSRNYLLDRTTGEITFGNGIHGMIPPIGLNNIISSYRIGGGEAGNFDAFSISKPYSSIKYVDSAYNPIASDGGCETEPIENLMRRAPATFKHRMRAVSADDFIWLAKKASHQVARVKVLSDFNGSKKDGMGWTTIVIVPESSDPKPMFSTELKHRVEIYLKNRCSNVGKLRVIGASYWRVDVTAEVVANNMESMPSIEFEARTKIAEFLHPLKGGVDGKGWDFGNTLSISDIYSLLEPIEDVEHVKNVTITFRDEKEILLQLNDPTEMATLPESTLPFSGEHEITVGWQSEKEE